MLKNITIHYKLAYFRQFSMLFVFKGKCHTNNIFGSWTTFRHFTFSISKQ